ncbi:MAG: T9SS type A sorting domain-containing protein [Bacteroidota bacterium]
MKKQLLITTGILVSGLLSAQVSKKSVDSKIPAHLSNVAIKKSAVDPDVMYTGLPFQIQSKVATAANAARTSMYNETVVGKTIYDLQSNSSVGDRIVVNADGTIATCWTIEPTDASGSYANRGTGYNYYNGSTWAFPIGTGPTARIENARVGWGNIVNTRSGAELVLSHNGGVSKAHIASRPVKGQGAWANSTTSFPSVTGGNWWPRMVSSSATGGDTVYALTITYPVANGGTVYNGVDGAILFSRSVDAGATWDIQNIQPTGFTSANYLGFGGDAYAITAKGSTVAIVAGDSDTDIGLSKSTDGGVTWTYTRIYKFPITLWDSGTTISDADGDNVADTLKSNDGSFAIALDNNGIAYVSYGAYKVLGDDPAAGTSYFPYLDGLYLWNETMPVDLGGNIVAGVVDANNDGVITFPPATSPVLAMGRWGCSLTSFPSMAFDASNALYLSYSSVVDSLLSATGDKLVRHQYVMKSCDLTPGAEVFTTPMDITMPNSNPALEGVFGTMAKNIDGNVHIIYQRDFFPGNGIPGTAASPNPDTENLDQGGDNEIVYTKIPVSDFVCVTGVKEATLSSVSNMNFYPNPASTNAILDIQLTENTKLEVSILNTVGQSVYSTSVAGTVGANKVELNLNNLSSGMYFYQVKIGNSKAITKKFAVSK